MSKKLLLALLVTGGLLAAQTTRTVAMSWTPSSTTGIVGYTIATSSSATGTFSQIGCTGTVAGSTCVSGSTASTTSYTDNSETIGSTVYYQVTPIAAACIATTPVTAACGTGTPAATSTTIPLKPGITSVVLVVP